jgi:hypothetical protein
VQYDLIANNLGDCLLSEPPLAALSARQGFPVDIYVKHEHNREQWTGNPFVNLVDTPGGYEVIPEIAMHLAVEKSAYFGIGYWYAMKIGMLPLDRLEPKIFNVNKCLSNCVVICPFSSSCYSNKGQKPNKQAPVEWWTPLIDKIQDAGMPVVSLGGPDDIFIMNTINIRGLSLRRAAEIILGAKVLVTLDSWSLHVGTIRESGLVCLNSAFPDWYVRANSRVDVIQAHSPLYWSRNEIFDAIMKKWEAANSLDWEDTCNGN